MHQEKHRQFNRPISGEFNINFKYDQLDTEENPAIREVIWAFQAFRLIPPEETCTRELWDEYIKRE